MGKVNSHNKGNEWEKTNIPNLQASQIFWGNQKSIQFPKCGKSGFPQYGKSMEKHNHFKFMGFLNILGEAGIRKIPKIWEK